jgi:hypothetical protein
MIGSILMLIGVFLIVLEYIAYSIKSTAGLILGSAFAGAGVSNSELQVES